MQFRSMLSMRLKMNLLVPSVSLSCHVGSPTQTQGSVFGGALAVTHAVFKVSKRSIPVAFRDPRSFV